MRTLKNCMTAFLAVLAMLVEFHSSAYASGLFATYKIVRPQGPDINVSAAMETCGPNNRPIYFHGVPGSTHIVGVVANDVNAHLVVELSGNHGEMAKDKDRKRLRLDSWSRKYNRWFPLADQNPKDQRHLPRDERWPNMLDVTISANDLCVGENRFMAMTENDQDPAVIILVKYDVPLSRLQLERGVAKGALSPEVLNDPGNDRDNDHENGRRDDGRGERVRSLPANGNNGGERDPIAGEDEDLDEDTPANNGRPVYNRNVPPRRGARSNSRARQQAYDVVLDKSILRAYHAGRLPKLEIWWEVNGREAPTNIVFPRGANVLRMTQPCDARVELIMSPESSRCWVCERRVLNRDGVFVYRCHLRGR